MVGQVVFPKEMKLLSANLAKRAVLLIARSWQEAATTLHRRTIPGRRMGNWHDEKLRTEQRKSSPKLNIDAKE